MHTEKGFNKAPAFSYYFGPYWVENKFYNVPYKMYKNNLEVFNCLIPLVEKVAKKISFSLVPEFLDLRPFQWWNYHLNEGNKFNLNLRYTGRYHFKEEIHKECLIASFRTDDKRKKLRKIYGIILLKFLGECQNTPVFILTFISRHSCGRVDLFK